MALINQNFLFLQKTCISEIFCCYAEICTSFKYMPDIRLFFLKESKSIMVGGVVMPCLIYDIEITLSEKDMCVSKVV